ncbi:MAG: U32 family peptidase [Prevotella sp.]
MRVIELLAPAKNTEYGMAAIDHGADAVYIGPQKFGARVAAGNTIDDIRRLCDYAHKFGAKVYATVNTIIYDNETEAAIDMMRQLHDAGTDAVLIQDMSLLKADLPDMAIHASTQTDNRTADKVRWLSEMGCSRVVLARELSLNEIAGIHRQVPDIELEAFVHGALCVSYSGLCYASHYCFGRSANRGECAQFCRLKFDLLDANGNTLDKDRHLLSLKDMCRIDSLQQMMEAGVTSFKIEGRLKDLAYVKNVTAAYSERINNIIRQHPDKYRRASLGKCSYSFTPDPAKTFNRGYTDYFLCGKRDDIASPDTPKAKGVYVGHVKEIKGNSFTVAGTAVFTNGDGLCFIGEDRQLEGFRVNKVINNRIFPPVMPKSLKAGMALYRNNDKAFDAMLSKPSATRKINISMSLDMTKVIGSDSKEATFTLSATTDRDISACVSLTLELQKAQKPQAENIRQQLTKLGNTPFACEDISISEQCAECFIPSSMLSDLRRRLTDELSKNIISYTRKTTAGQKDKNKCRHTAWYPQDKPYLYNVSNDIAAQVYAECGLDIGKSSFETSSPTKPLLMQCKHCIRHMLGHCKKKERTDKWNEPLFLRLADGRKFTIGFNCDKCVMEIYGT